MKKIETTVTSYEKPNPLQAIHAIQEDVILHSFQIFQEDSSSHRQTTRRTPRRETRH